MNERLEKLLPILIVGGSIIFILLKMKMRGVEVKAVEVA